MRLKLFKRRVAIQQSNIQLFEYDVYRMNFLSRTLYQIFY